MQHPYTITSLRHAVVPTGTFIRADLVFASGLGLTVYMSNRPPVGGRYPSGTTTTVERMYGDTWVLTVAGNGELEQLVATRWLFDHRADLVAVLLAALEDELANPGARHAEPQVHTVAERGGTCPHCGGRGWHWTTCAEAVR